MRDTWAIYRAPHGEPRTQDGLSLTSIYPPTAAYLVTLLLMAAIPCINNLVMSLVATVDTVRDPRKASISPSSEARVFRFERSAATRNLVQILRTHFLVLREVERYPWSVLLSYGGIYGGMGGQYSHISAKIPPMWYFFVEFYRLVPGLIHTLTYSIAGRPG